MKFIGNKNGVVGGGLSIFWTSNHVMIKNCSFSGNNALKGGGLFLENSQTIKLINLNFYYNEAY